MNYKYLIFHVFLLITSITRGGEIQTGGTTFPGDKLSEQKMDLLYIGMAAQKTLKKKSTAELTKICDYLIRIQVSHDSDEDYFDPYEITMVSFKQHNKPNKVNVRYSSWVSYNYADSHLKVSHKITSFENIGSKDQLVKVSADMLKWKTQGRMSAEEASLGGTSYLVTVIHKGKHKNIKFSIGSGKGKKEKVFLRKLRDLLVKIKVPLTRVLPYHIIEELQ